MTEHFWKGFWMQLRWMAPVVIPVATILVLAAVWDILT